MGKDGKLLYPVFAVNDVETKWDFDNVYGTGQSTLDGILRASSVFLAGKNFVVAGYGHCGRGVAMRAQGMGANVIITEVKPTAALKATLDGMRVMTMDEAAKVGDIFVTATGMKDIIRGEHFVTMKEGAIVSNTGHYDVEIDLVALNEIAVSKRTVRTDNVEYTLDNGRKIYVLADGRLVNLAAAEGHPSEVMDMSFANQFQAHLELIQRHEAGVEMPKDVLDLPEELDQQIAQMKLETMGIVACAACRSHPGWSPPSPTGPEGPPRFSRGGPLSVCAFRPQRTRLGRQPVVEAARGSGTRRARRGACGGTRRPSRRGWRACARRRRRRSPSKPTASPAAHGPTQARGTRTVSAPPSSVAASASASAARRP